MQLHAVAHDIFPTNANLFIYDKCQDLIQIKS